MGSIVFDIAVWVFTFVAGVLYDLFAVASRPLAMSSALLGLVFIENDFLAIFRNVGLFLGITSTLSVGLLVLAGVMILRLPSGSEKVFIFPWVLDGWLQMASAVGLFPSYPRSHTAVLATMLQIPVGIAVYGGSNHWPRIMTGCLSATMWINFFQESSRPESQTAQVILAVVAAVPTLFTAIPFSVVRFLIRMVVEPLSSLLLSIYLLFVTAWPAIRRFMAALVEHPLLVRPYQLLIAPLWRVFSPLVMPLLTGYICYLLCLASYRFFTGAEATDLSYLSLCTVVAQLLCALSSALSCVMLLMHAYSRIRRVAIDPLSSRIFTVAITSAAYLLSLPFKLVRLLFRGRIVRFIVDFLSALFSAAASNPFLTIFFVLVGNTAGFFVVYYSPAGEQLYKLGLLLWNYLASLFAGLFQGILSIQEGSLENTADQRLALLLITVTQIIASNFQYNNLLPVRHSPAASTDNNGHSMTIDELNAIAATMTSPRQCGRCGFGPVDHYGCNSLSSHHNERVGNRFISNACPNCNWFVPQLDRWPRWNGLLRSESGLQVLRQRVWAEAVILVRTASKALIIPFFILRLAGPTFPTLAPLLAFSYIIPWSVENVAAYRHMDNSLLLQPGPAPRQPARRGDARRRNRRGNNNTNNNQTRNPTETANTSTNPTSTTTNTTNFDEVVCCGSSSQPQEPEVRIEASQALANILEAVPETVYLTSGEPCSVCLDEFVLPEGQQATPENLRALQPPLVALRCGHVLHIQCAEALVAAANSRHVRCPLCREPVSFAGAFASRLFS